MAELIIGALASVIVVLGLITTIKDLITIRRRNGKLNKSELKWKLVLIFIGVVILVEKISLFIDKT